METKITSLRTKIFILAFFFFGISFVSDAQHIEHGGGPAPFEKGTCLHENDRLAIKAQLKKNIDSLQAIGIAIEPNFQTNGNFIWPVKGVSFLDYYNVDMIYNYVDHDESNNIEDYTCDSRSYDGHKGIDIATWPFPWYLKENDLVEVVACDAGLIIGKQETQDDESCSWGGNTSWNAIYIQHSDGSVAWYGHLKKFSLTTKDIGEMVAQGEYLGIVASSGFSTGPHLHLEVYDADDELVDPYAGSCNNLNDESWWASQPDYKEPRVNAVLTHDKEPVHGCPHENEKPYYRNGFDLGDYMITAGYYKDQPADVLYGYRIVDASGEIWQEWSHASPKYYSGSWWWWSWNLPEEGPFGQWQFIITQEGVDYVQNFNYGQPSIIEDLATALDAELYPNPANDKIYVKGETVFRGVVKIFTAQGHLVLEEPTFIDFLSIEPLVPGIYFVVLEVGAKKKIQKLVIQ